MAQERLPGYNSGCQSQSEPGVPETIVNSLKVSDTRLTRRETPLIFLTRQHRLENTSRQPGDREKVGQGWHRRHAPPSFRRAFELMATAKPGALRAENGHSPARKKAGCAEVCAQPLSLLGRIRIFGDVSDHNAKAIAMKSRTAAAFPSNPSQTSFNTSIPGQTSGADQKSIIAGPELSVRTEISSFAIPGQSQDLSHAPSFGDSKLPPTR
jgi:hypothetical protein